MSVDRRAVVRAAELKLREAVNAASQKLTGAELVQVMATVFGTELGWVAEGMVEEERKETS